jgi:hypothetical protein
MWQSELAPVIALSAVYWVLVGIILMDRSPLAIKSRPAFIVVSTMLWCAFLFVPGCYVIPILAMTALLVRNYWTRAGESEGLSTSVSRVVWVLLVVAALGAALTVVLWASLVGDK